MLQFAISAGGAHKSASLPPIRLAWLAGVTKTAALALTIYRQKCAV